MDAVRGNDDVETSVAEILHSGLARSFASGTGPPGALSSVLERVLRKFLQATLNKDFAPNNVGAGFVAGELGKR